MTIRTPTSDFTDEERAAFRKAGRIGGLTFVARNDAAASAAHMRKIARAGWLLGHGCKVCGDRIEIPADIPMADKKRRAAALRTRHFTLLANLSHRKRWGSNR